jgi:hypothetical protein
VLKTRIPKLWRPKLWTPTGEGREILCNWVREDDGQPGPLIEMQRYRELLKVLPDKVVENLEKARLARDGRMPMLKAGLGYEELLSSVIVDGTAIASSSTEAFLFPALMIPANYLQPGGIPGRTLHWKVRGRVTTLTTTATMTFKVGAALTNVIPTTTWCVSGAMPCDATAQTNTQWFIEGTSVVRSVGSAGTMFSQGDANFPPIGVAGVLSPANAALALMGSTGSAAPSTAACDMTVNQFFGVTAKWSLTTAYSIQGHIFILEALN